MEGFDVVFVVGFDVFGNFGEGLEGGYLDFGRFGVDERDREDFEKVLEVRFKRFGDGVEDWEKDVNGSFLMSFVGRVCGLVKIGYKSRLLRRGNSEFDIGNSSNCLSLGVLNNGVRKEVIS